MEDLNRLSGSVASPCVRNCCLDAHDICLGCNRSIAEIMAWGAAGNEERKAILERCRLRSEQRGGNNRIVPEVRG